MNPQTSDITEQHAQLTNLFLLSSSPSRAVEVCTAGGSGNCNWLFVVTVLIEKGLAQTVVLRISDCSADALGLHDMNIVTGLVKEPGM